MITGSWCEDRACRALDEASFMLSADCAKRRPFLFRTVSSPDPLGSVDDSAAHLRNFFFFPNII
jgi:hypothetical protein